MANLLEGQEKRHVVVGIKELSTLLKRFAATEILLKEQEYS
jgi:hypothetical protein